MQSTFKLINQFHNLKVDNETYTLCYYTFFITSASHEQQNHSPANQNLKKPSCWADFTASIVLARLTTALESLNMYITFVLRSKDHSLQQ